ncbi:hypothetical protein JXR93_11255, partial [bacterium]|nr:hypothetical protein [bacterium]
MTCENYPTACKNYPTACKNYPTACENYPTVHFYNKKRLFVYFFYVQRVKTTLFINKKIFLLYKKALL